MAPPTTQGKKKKGFKPKRYHFWSVLLFIFGSLFPPLAIAARFGIGSDFFINLGCTICGYIPGHVHNFYCQNIRNNKTHARTPKWVQRYGLVDTSALKRKERKSQWAGRYQERNPHSALEDQGYEEGQAPAGDPEDVGGERRNRVPEGEGGLWTERDEAYYGRDDASSTAASGAGRWHYPANFDDAVSTPDMKKDKRKKKEKKDRWARTEDAYTAQDAQPARRKSSKRRQSKTELDQDVFAPAAPTHADSIETGPEDATGGGYGAGRRSGEGRARATAGGDDEFSHTF